MEYLLKAVDLCNKRMTIYGAGAHATLEWANTYAVDWCADNLVPAKQYKSDGLILWLDVVNNTGSNHNASAKVWKDLSGNGNDFTLYNSPTINDNDIAFSPGTTQYARSTAMLDLSSYNAITVEISFKLLSLDQRSMLFDHPNDWNNNAGAFGVYLNSDGGSAVIPNVCNTVQNISGSATAGANNYNLLLDDMTYHRMTNTYSAVPNPTGRLMYHDGELLSSSGLYHKGTAIYNTFRNGYLFLASRDGRSSWNNVAIQSVRVYNRQLSASEICDNAWIDFARFGGTAPNCG
ncbi:MAG: LamG domain-containing protein [Rickettsiales bacterium]|jgi:hypothetical protein|nr:LamG domain-containing protein [Rickettsiales bacterium]